MALILTAELDSTTQETFNDLRQRYFPPKRNLLSAHVTLFHALPDELQTEIDGVLSAEIARSPIAVDVIGLQMLGNGVAYRLKSEDLAHLRSTLANKWDQHLTPQDANKHELHVTVQNKVTHETAQHTMDELEAAFSPYSTTCTGLKLWRYMDGPWDALQTYAFTVS